MTPDKKSKEKERRKIYRQNNREKLLEACRKWREENPEKYKMSVIKNQLNEYKKRQERRQNKIQYTLAVMRVLYDSL